MKILSIVGARPQFIKAAAVSQVIREKHHEWLVHTGQHYDHNMSAVFFEELGIPAPDYNLAIGSTTHGKQTGAMLVGIEEILLELKPDAVVVYGDTNSTLAGALAASKLSIPVAHVEAGLRSWNMSMPEEQNRIVADHLSTWLFCPSEQAMRNLEREGLQERAIFTGDVMYDAILRFREHINIDLVDRFQIPKRRYFLFTLHRAENTDQADKVWRMLLRAQETGYPVLFPAHPRTLKLLAGAGYLLDCPETIKIIPPVSYLEMLALESAALGVLTDSGGVQKEAFFLRTPCITMREETEWVETLGDDWNQLVGMDIERLELALRTLISSDFSARDQRLAYGIGDAALTIRQALEKALAN